MLLALPVKESLDIYPVNNCDCVIPAAGRSSRMGQWKPLLPFGGSTILQTVVVTALRACARVIVVTGFRGEELAARFGAELRVHVVHNEGWERGMFSSIQLGVGQVRTPWFFVTLGDLPWITPGVYHALLTGDDTSDVVFPVHDGRRGHPVLFHERVKPAVAAADPASGSMRAIARGFREAEIPWPDDSVVRDVDTPADLADR